MTHVGKLFRNGTVFQIYVCSYKNQYHLLWLPAGESPPPKLLPEKQCLSDLGWPS